MDDPGRFHAARLVEEGTRLLTRDQGEGVRRRLRDRIEKGERLDILFDGVEVVTPSFADECLGRLLLEVGRPTFRERVRLRTTDETIRRLVNHVLARRGAQDERARPSRRRSGASGG